MTLLYRLVTAIIIALITGNIQAQAPKQIELVNSDSLMFDQKRGADLKLLYGHVQFRHEGALLFCDSAHFYSAQNMLNAYSHVRIKNGDTLTIVGDSLLFFGNQSLAQLRGSVTMKDRTMTLTTHFLDYDLKNNIGKYFNDGKIQDTSNTLTSETGTYYAHGRDAYFHKKVVLHNKDYDIYTDTMKYNTTRKISYFVGPTDIISKENFIYCENGWYNTPANQAAFGKNSYIQNKEKYLYGDSLFYDREQHYGKAYNNVLLKDTTQKTDLWGNYGYYKEKPEFALVTKQVLMTRNMEGDTLFLHADTVQVEFDSTQTYRMFKAFHKVRFWKSDFQGKCDSLLYTMKDSTMNMYRNPVLWSDKHQISGDFIKTHSTNNEIDRLYVNNSAFLASQDDSTRFNQVKGVNMVGFIKNRELYRLDVLQNGETVYYMRSDSVLTGVNKTTCENMSIYFKNKEADRIVFKKKPTGKIHPPHELKKDEQELADFKWQAEIRPVDRYDIFKWRVLPQDNQATSTSETETKE